MAKRLVTCQLDNYELMGRPPTCGVRRLQGLKQLAHGQANRDLLAPGTLGQAQLALQQERLQVVREVLWTW